MAGFDQDRWGAAEGGPDPVDTAAAARRVKGPGMALLLVAIVNIIFVIGLIIALATISTWLPGFFRWAMSQPGAKQEDKDKMEEAIQKLNEQGGVEPQSYVFPVLGLIVNVVVLLGAMKMRRLESYGLALTASILSLVPIPTMSPCCCLALPFGIWAIVVLVKPEVKSAFR